MKYLYISLCLFAFATPAIAQMMQSSADTPRRLGSSDGAPKWTTADVQAMCEGRWPGQDNNIKDCVSRNQAKIGGKESPADIQLINASKPDLIKPVPGDAR